MILWIHNAIYTVTYKEIHLKTLVNKHEILKSIQVTHRKAGKKKEKWKTKETNGKQKIKYHIHNYLYLQLPQTRNN